MRILQLCLSPDFGGLEKFFRDFIRWWADQDRSSLHLGLQAGTTLAEELGPRELPTLFMPRPATYLPLILARRLARYVDVHHIDVIHIHWKFDLPLVALARYMVTPRPRIVHSRHMDLPGQKRDPYHRLLYNSVDLYHTVTEAVAAQARRHLPLAPERIETLYLGAEVPEPLSELERIQIRSGLGLDDTFTVGVIGRISAYKGQHLLVEAIRQLRSQGVAIQAVVAGAAMEQNYLTQLKQIVRDRGLDDYVQFMGFQTDPYMLMQSLDVLVLTTVKETFGLVLVEAMMLGVPVIGSDAGGVPEIIEHEATGLLFESENVTALAEQIKRLFDHPELRRTLAAQGRQAAQRRFNKDTQYSALKRRIELLVQPVEA